jgi:hypothetical protein
MNSQKILREGLNATDKFCPMMFLLSSRDHIQSGLGPKCIGEPCAWFTQYNYMGIRHSKCGMLKIAEKD